VKNFIFLIILGAVLSAASSVNAEFQIRSEDGTSTLKLKGLAQLDGRFFIGLPQNLGVNTFLPRSIRPILEGTVYDRFSFRLAPDFGNGAAVLQDAYLDVRFVPELKLRGGKFKEPVGLERLQAENNQLFVERGLPTNLVPNRDVGLQLFGDLGVVSYAVGAFNGVADGASADTDPNDGKDVAGRLFVQPFSKTEIESLQGLGVGIAGTYGKQKGTTASPNLPTFRTPGQQTFFRYLNDTTSTPNNITVASGTVYRLAPQANYYWGPFGLFGEYVRSSQRVTNNNGSTNLLNHAWQTAASYVLTGEKASYKGVKPKNPLDPKEGKWGAVEIAARYNELRVDGSAFPNFADYEQTLFAGGAAAGANRQSEKAILSRLELAF